ncbi:hypothetical protein ABZ208_17495 [Streptomyces sp. NPDC006208]|uniref:hypothetical protein n=1 Tax=Streptomyces sp. NPDC006208 TaxID=3156734 RepID=UPI0033BDEE56
MTEQSKPPDLNGIAPGNCPETPKAAADGPADERWKLSDRPGTVTAIVLLFVVLCLGIAGMTSNDRPGTSTCYGTCGSR